MKALAVGGVRALSAVRLLPVLALDFRCFLGFLFRGAIFPVGFRIPRNSSERHCDEDHGYRVSRNQLFNDFLGPIFHIWFDESGYLEKLERTVRKELALAEFTVLSFWPEKIEPKIPLKYL